METKRDGEVASQILQNPGHRDRGREKQRFNKHTEILIETMTEIEKLNKHTETKKNPNTKIQHSWH